MRHRRLLVPTAALWLATAPFAFGQIAEDRIEGDVIHHVLPKDRIPAIDEPQLVLARDAVEFMRDDEPVIGVVGPDGQARCYSAWQLDLHEIVNDRFGDQPYMVTW